MNSTFLVVIDFVQRTWHLFVSLSGDNVMSVNQYRILHVSQKYTMFRIARCSDFCNIEKSLSMDATL